MLCRGLHLMSPVPAMMRNTPRTFVGTVIFRLEEQVAPDAGALAEGFDLMPEVRVSAVDSGDGAVLVTALRPTDRNDVVVALARLGYRVC